MRSTLADQDLTDYALNELEANQRAYVESMLAVSEECRHDVYEMIDTALLLEEAFEREDAQLDEALTPEQREKLVTYRPRTPFAVQFSGVLAAAAAVALVFTHPGFWQMQGGAQRVAKVSTSVSNYVVEAVTPEEGVDFKAQLANVTQLADDPVLKKWFNSDWFSGEHLAPAASFASPMPNWDPMPRTSFEAMP